MTVMLAPQSLEERLRQIRARIAEAAQRAGRSPGAVTLVAVTKGVPAQTIREALAAGVRDLGENRLQEALAKRAQLTVAGRAGEAGQDAVRWHLVGHLQRNKAREAVRWFDVVHSVDSLPLIEALERQAAGRSRALEVFVQVNVSGESTKFGCRPGQLPEVASALQECAHLRLAGLMTIPPFAEDPQASRPWFDRLRQLRTELAASLGRPAAELRLSMGMSHDFEVAIEAGADVVRIGTALFGAGGAGEGTGGAAHG
jgi:hypothetical protein